MADPFNILPVGRHSAGVEQLMQGLPAAAGASSPYGVGPQVGSEAYLADVQRLSRSAAATPTPEELESLRWNNWSAANGFAHAPDATQRQMAKQYYENILPYVASGTGAEATTYQRQFHANYPNVARLLEPQNDIESRTQYADQFGLEGEERSRYALTGQMPVARASAAVADQFGARRNEMENLRTQYQAEGTEFPFTPEQEADYILTGKITRPTSADRARTSKAEAEASAKTAGTLRGAELIIEQTEDALRQADQILDLAGYGIDEEGALTGEGRGFFEPAVAGRFSELVYNNPFNPVTFDANKVRTYLQTLRASSVFNSLQALRDASVDGSSGLGQVTNVEINLLASRVAALDPANMTDEDLAREVAHIRGRLQDYMQKAQETVALAGGGQPVLKSMATEAPTDTTVAVEGVLPDDEAYLDILMED